MKELEKEIKDLLSQLHRRDSNAVQALQGDMSAERESHKIALEVAEDTARSSRKARQAALNETNLLREEHKTLSQEVMTLRLSLEAEAVRANAAENCVADLAAQLSKANTRLGIEHRMVEHRDRKISDSIVARVEMESEMARARAEKESELAVARQQADERLITIRKMAGKLGGKPVVNRSQEDLDVCLQATAYSCETRMTARMLTATGCAETEGAISGDAFMDGVVEGGWMDTVWESQQMWKKRMEWVEELKDDLRLVWTPTLTCEIRDKLSVSYDKLDELRFKLSHNRVGKQLRPRPWVINPWTGERANFPQPIAPRSGRAGWCHLVKVMQERCGLRMDATGRVAQRSFRSTVAAQVRRDEGRGLLRAVTEADPLVVVLGADGTGVGKRSITHVATSIAPSYRTGISTQNEMNLNTIATSVTDDHWCGLNETLCGSCYSGSGDQLPPDSIAAELNAINRTGKLDNLPAKVVGCFDLVAARGIRGGRGRCACHTEATTAADRFSIPLVTEDSTWDEVQAVMSKLQPLLVNATLRNDSHTPPEAYDYDKEGPWRCSRPGCNVVFKSRAEYLAARQAFQTAKADKSSAGKKLTSSRAAAYALIHPSQQGEFEPPCTELNMIDILIDPLHCLMLNLPKVIWKYCWGDRMTHEQRELVAEYLVAIGCPLDVRAKGDGRDANNKWFSGEAFAWFCEGNERSPGLAENVAAIMDIIYLKCPAPPPPPTAAATAAAAPDVNKDINR